MTRKPPTPAQLVIQLKALTKALEDNGHTAVQLAPILAARGWPTSTLSDGSRGNTELTSVESAADKASPYDDIDLKLRWFLSTTYALTSVGQSLLTQITAHAALDEQHQGRATGTGAGSCLACNRWVAGTADDRLRAGFCDRCRKAWERAGRPDRAAFVHTRPKHDDPHRPPDGGDTQLTSTDA